ncbi:MAG: beta-lactamase family protein [Proteobacteria bacterium]|nr:beta-lactamase family protein [Pseudomonadota bacterium]
MTAIHGTVAPGFEPVKRAFRTNFDKHDEIGASFAVYRHGELVVDLWAGVADPDTGRAWERDTPMLMFSATKGLVAMRFLQLFDQGLFDPDAPVAEVWPEFARKGKSGITGRMLLNHRAGLSALDMPLKLEDFADPSGRVHEALIEQEPMWEPDTHQGYCAISYGPYAGEFLYRLTGERFGASFDSQIAKPLGIDVWSGAPDDVIARAGTLLPIGGRDLMRNHIPTALTRRTPEGRLFRRLARKSSYSRRAFGNPSIDFRDLNKPEILRLDLPWMGAVGSSVGLAKAYAALLGEVDGVRLVSDKSLRPIKLRQSWSTRDRVLHKPLGWSQGFLKDRRGVFSPNVASFGHAGAGGSVGWADPETGLAIGYVMNRMDWRIRSPRTVMLCKAVYDSLEAMGA